MRRIAISILCSLIIAMGGFYWTVVRPALAGVTCSLPFTLTNGTIADATQVMANYNALVTCLTNAAAAGANNDITSLSALTTPITPNEGGSNVYIGATPTVSGNQIIIASTTPAGYSNTKGYSVIFTAIATNTSAETLNVNGQGQQNIFKASTAGPIALTGNEIVPNQVYQAIYDGTEFQINPVPSLALGWGLQAQTATLTGINLTNPPYGFGPCVNMTIAATVGSNLLGLQLFAADTGVAPTGQHPILCNFRDSTVANGDPLWVTINSAVYMDTNAAGASLGTINGLPFRIWVVLFYNGGTPKLGLWQSTSFTVGAFGAQSNNIFLNSLNESDLQSPTGISAAATSAGTYYTGNGLSISNSPFRILGYFDFGNGLATAGSYTSGPTKIQLFGPGVRKAGDRINYVTATLATGQQTANTYSPSATPPAPANGVTIVSQTISPIASMDVIRIHGYSQGFNNTSGEYAIFLYNGTKTVAYAGGLGSASANHNGVNASVAFSTIVTAGSQTFTLYGTSVNGTTTVNGFQSGLPISGAASLLEIEELVP